MHKAVFRAPRGHKTTKAYVKIVWSVQPPKAGQMRNRGSIHGRSKIFKLSLFARVQTGWAAIQSPTEYVPWLLPQSWSDSGVKLIAYLHIVRRFTINRVLRYSPYMLSGRALGQLYL